MEQYLLRVRVSKSVSRALWALFLALIFAGGGRHIAAAQETKMKVPIRPPVPAKPARMPAYREDVLLVMPQRGADAKEVLEVFKDLRGEVLETIGEGDLICYVLKVENGRMLECERKLAQDKHFSAVQRDYVFQAN